jgi:hypothetical protein
VNRREQVTRELAEGKLHVMESEDMHSQDRVGIENLHARDVFVVVILIFLLSSLYRDSREWSEIKFFKPIGSSWLFT